MFEDRSNWIGLGLLILCGLSAGTMLGYIERGEIATWNGPGWLGWTIIGAGVALIGFGVIQSLRGKFLGNDIRGPKRNWWRRSDDPGNRKL